jgi:hypothetical protein
MLNLKQPFAGIAATALVIAISLGFISLFDAPKFMGWVSFCLISIIPMEIVIGVAWGCKKPDFAHACGQPLKGILLIVLTFLVGAIGGAVTRAVVGGNVNPPAPMLMMCTIAMVVMTFTLTIMFGGWPFSSFIKNPIASGLSMLAATYVINYLLFRLFFNYASMQGAPVYVPSLDPHGLFNANLALVFYITTNSIMFVVLNFELWPFTLSASLMRQPLLGLAWTLLCLALGGVVFYVGIFALKMDPLQFMVRVPIPFVFGTIIVLNMLHGTLYSKFAQPVRGILNAVTAAAIGTVLALLYSTLSSYISGPLKTGPPANDFEIWLASALLGVTFPFLIFYAEFLQFWQLRKHEPRIAESGD